ncbi:MAG TPA: SDR family NAD(P)-dependent oxidoreductase [Herpetosiphonaceae bacterium]|jgi:NAD(P)-dependent dehydrogenase (short-subunit alcohol dehydrogenase family)|nr:SDR family NAD(P)-dependent oxidoreductase [Herpetosiphonaceae bacterium]
MRFKDKVCIVSGGGSGIGQAACERFAAEGGKVCVVDLNADHGNETVQKITKAGGEAIFAKANVGNSAEVQAAIKATVDKWGKIDVVVNDAAMMTFKPIVELSEDDWNKVLDVNLTSVFLFCKYAVPHMPKGSAIVNISSVHAHETTRNVVPYATSKGGMEAFTRGFSEELESRKIRINCVAPGAVDTPMLWDNPNVKSGAEKIEGAVGEPKDIAAAICFLAASEARFITGTTLVVDGGRLDIL